MKKLCLEDTTVSVLKRASTGQVYDVYMYTPEQLVDVPRKGLPVYYFLDGNASFLLAREMMRTQAHRKQIRRILPGIIVGITEQSRALFPDSRKTDFTTPAKVEAMREWFEDRGLEMFDAGGASSFREFLQHDVMGHVNETFHTNREYQVLVGHSLGGLFALDTLVEQPDLFQKYMIGSPSLWWNGGEVIEALDVAEIKAPVHVTIGAEEPFQMKEACRQLVDKLDAGDVETSYTEFEHQNHLSSLMLLIQEAIKS